MLKKLFIILNILSLVNGSYAMDDSNVYNQTTPEKVASVALHLLENAWLKRDALAITRLTNFNDFLDNKKRLDLSGYLNNLEKLGIDTYLHYSYLKLITDPYTVLPKDMNILQGLITKFAVDILNRGELFGDIIFLIQKFSANAWRDTHQGSLLLNQLAGLFETLDPQNTAFNLSLKRRLKTIAKALIMHGANPMINCGQGTAFNQTVFYKQYEKCFQGCLNIYALRIQIFEALKQKNICQIKKLTNFEDYVTDGDLVDTHNYFITLERLALPSSLYDLICAYSSINYQNSEGERYLHTRVGKWLEQGFDDEEFSALSELLTTFSVRELNKVDRKLGSLLDYLLDLYNACNGSSLNYKLQQLINILLTHNVNLENLSTENKKLVIPLIKQLMSYDNRTLENNTGKPLGKIQKGIKNNKNGGTSGHENTVAHKIIPMVLFSTAAIVICYFSYHLLLPQKNVVRSQVKLS